MYWNDAQGRTKEQVIDALSSAIAIAEAEGASARQAGRTQEDLLQFDRNMMQRLELR
jgi:hypothetical protein